MFIREYTVWCFNIVYGMHCWCYQSAFAACILFVMLIGAGISVVLGIIGFYVFPLFVTIPAFSGIYDENEQFETGQAIMIQ